MPHFPTTLYWFDTLLQFLEYSKMFLWNELENHQIMGALNGSLSVF
jgi:hypothetical protein